MSLNLLTRSTLALTGAVFSLGAIAIHPASAARITYDFSVNFWYRNAPGPFTGRFSYDEATEIKSIYPTMFGEPGLVIDQTYQIDAMEFSFLDRVYTQADSLSPIQWHIARFLDKEERRPLIQVLSWTTEDFQFLGSYYQDVGSTVFTTPNYSSWNISFSRVEEEPTPVPEPTLLGGFSLLGFAGILVKKRRKAQLVD